MVEDAGPSATLKILLIGELNFDIILQGLRGAPTPGMEVLVDDFEMTLGSSCAITGAGLVKLGHSATFIGRTGADPGGRFCVERMLALGLDVSRVKLDPALKTGVTVAFTSQQDRSLVSYLGGTTALTADEIGDDAFAGFDHLHSSSYFLQKGLQPGFADVYARASLRGMTTSLDPACDPADEWKSGLQNVLRYVDVFLPNEVELTGITGEKDAVKGLRALQNGRTLTVAKLGSRGAMTLYKDELIEVTAPIAEPVDLTGAGDCFNAGFLHGWLNRWDLRRAMDLGVACGSFSIRGLGGTGAQPSEQQAFEFLEAARA